VHGLEGDEVHDSGRDRCMEWRAIGAWNRGWITESDRCLGCRQVSSMCWRVDRCMQWRAMRCMVWRVVGAWVAEWCSAYVGGWIGAWLGG